MMKQLLSIVLREQFTFFYRCSYTFLPKSSLLVFDGVITNEIKTAIVKQFKTVSPYYYDEEYIILQFEKPINENDDIIKFEIQELVKIYPLSNQAKDSIESKIDQRIRLENPIFETVLPKIESHIQQMEVEKAISALWEICKIASPLDKHLSDIGIENIFKGLEHRKNGTKANKIQNGSYWEYLIAYDYFQYFPQGIIRHFYQLGEVFSYYKGKADGIEGTKIEDLLKQIDRGNFEQILQMFSDEALPQSFVESMKEIGKSKFNPIIISVLFLKWKTDLSSQDIEITKSSIFHNGKIAFIDKFPNEVELALILLGAFFGFRKFYEPYYESLNLRYYKNYKEPQKEIISEEQEEKNVSEVTKKQTIEPKEINDKTLDEKDEEQDKVEKVLIENIPEETKTEKLTKGSDTEEDNQEGKSDISSQYRSIIEEALTKQPEIKLTDIAALIKERTGQKVQNSIVENVAKQMSGIEIIKIGRAKGIKRKAQTLFNE